MCLWCVLCYSSVPVSSLCRWDITLTFRTWKTESSCLFLSSSGTQNAFAVYFWRVSSFSPQALLRTLRDLFNPSRYPPVRRLRHRRHGGHSSDLQHPLHRHLRLQLGPAGRRGRDGRAEEPDKASPSARSSQGTAFISELTRLSVRWKAGVHTASEAEIGRTKCRALDYTDGFKYTLVYFPDLRKCSLNWIIRYYGTKFSRNRSTTLMVNLQNMAEIICEFIEIWNICAPTFFHPDFSISKQAKTEFHFKLPKCFIITRSLSLTSLCLCGQGRGGKGSVYVWAAGNGGMQRDHCGADGYVNSIYNIAIGAVSQTGKPASFGEPCPGVMAVTLTGAGVGGSLPLVTVRVPRKTSNDCVHQ